MSLPTCEAAAPRGRRRAYKMIAGARRDAIVSIDDWR
jgi:hypothetical protein